LRSSVEDRVFIPPLPVNLTNWNKASQLLLQVLTRICSGLFGQN